MLSIFHSINNIEYTDREKKEILYNLIHYFSSIYFIFFQRITGLFKENGFGGNLIYYDYIVKYKHTNNYEINLTNISPKFIFRHREYSSLLNYSCGNTFNIFNKNIVIMYGIGNYKMGVCSIKENILYDFTELNNSTLYIYDDVSNKFIDSIYMFSDLLFTMSADEISKMDNNNDTKLINGYFNKLISDIKFMLDLYEIIKKKISE